MKACAFVFVVLLFWVCSKKFMYTSVIKNGGEVEKSICSENNINSTTVSASSGPPVIKTPEGWDADQDLDEYYARREAFRSELDDALAELRETYQDFDLFISSRLKEALAGDSERLGRNVTMLSVEEKIQWLHQSVMAHDPAPEKLSYWLRRAEVILREKRRILAQLQQQTGRIELYLINQLSDQLGECSRQLERGSFSWNKHEYLTI
jgi:hypothetical protein